MHCLEVPGSFTWPSRLIHVGELFDCKYPLFFIVLHIFALDTSQQTQVVFFLSFVLTQVTKLARGTMFVQEKRGWLRRRNCHPFLQRLEQWEQNVGVIPKLYLVRDAIHRDNLPMFRKRSLYF